MRRIATHGFQWLLLCLFSTGALAQEIAVPALDAPGSSGLRKAGQLAKAGSALLEAFSEQQLHIQQGRTDAFRPRNRLLPFAAGQVLVNARAADSGTDLLNALAQVGLSSGTVAGSVVSGLLPLDALQDAVAIDGLVAITAATQPITHTGSITSQGDVALRAVNARSLNGVDGSGVTVGVLSDAYDTLGGAAADIASGDLPPGGVTLLSSESQYCGVLVFCIDEGRAMLQIVYDIAPGADLMFHHGLGGKAGYANAIRALRDAGADVIVDDLWYLDEPMFQDGVIAQAVDDVVASGVAYFSAAGNAGRKSYEAAFNDSGVIFCIEFFYPLGDCDPIYERVGRMHDFDPGPGRDVYQKITIPEDTVLNIALQWDAPFGGAGPDNDHDIVLVSENGGTYFALSANDNVTTREGWEVLQYENAAVLGHGENFSLIITYDDVDSQGPPANLLKMVVFGSATIEEYATYSATVMGHANAAGAQTVGAAFALETPEFGVAPPLQEPFSSAGGTPILYNTNGTPRTVAEIRPKPEITAVDGVNTTFFYSDLYGNDGLDDFFGTSAAAPHAAGVAALLLDAQPGATPAQIRTALQSTAIDMGDPGFDFDTGAGLIQADAAIEALLASGGNAPPSAGFTTTVTGLLVEFADTSFDLDGTVTSWDWDFGDGNGSVVRNPSHTYAGDGNYTVTLTVTDDATASDTASALVAVSDGGTANTPPSAAFSYACDALSCTFDGSASSDDNGITSYAWDFGDGTGDSGVTPLPHVYAAQGNYTVSLTVTDTDGATGSVATTFRVKNRGSLSGSAGGGGGGDTGGTTGEGEKGRKKCTDGIDNDGDGFIDSADSECQ